MGLFSLESISIEVVWVGGDSTELSSIGLVSGGLNCSAGVVSVGTASVEASSAEQHFDYKDSY